MGHENVSIGGSHLSPHGCALDLEVMMSQKIEIVVFEDEVEEIGYDVFGRGVGWQYVPVGLRSLVWFECLLHGEYLYIRRLHRL